MLLCSCGGKVDFVVEEDGTIKSAKCTQCGKELKFDEFKAKDYETALSILEVVFGWKSDAPISKSVVRRLDYQLRS